MSSIDDVLKETGDVALDLIKTNFKDILSQAKNDSLDEIKKTGEKVEKWLILRKEDEIDNNELESLLNARKRTVRQFILTKEINSRAKLEGISIDLIDTVTNQFIGSLFK